VRRVVGIGPHDVLHDFRREAEQRPPDAVKLVERHSAVDGERESANDRGERDVGEHVHEPKGTSGAP
jgi:hypothetical protein